MVRHLGLLALFLFGLAVGLAVDLRGVNPSDAALYSGSTFACKDSSKTGLPLAKVNDDYCDCSDGSDEPGTSACLNGHFFCRNLGHIGLSIFSSRVNDGICDCCDGADEYDGKAKCQDTCYALGEDTRNAKRQEGLVIRQDYEAQAKTVREAKQKRIEELKATLAHKEKDKQELQAQVDALEAKAKAAEELLARYKPKEMAPPVEGQEQVQPGTPVPVEDSEDDEDEYEDDEDDEEEIDDQVEVAPTGDGQAAEEQPKVELLERTDDVKEALEQAEKDIAEYKKASLWSKQDKENEEMEEGGEEEGVAASLWRKFLQSLGLASASSPPSSPLSREVKLTDLKELRTRLNSAQNEVDATTRDINSEEDYFKLDLGEDAFQGIRDQTFELQTNQYTYKFTPFKDVKQQNTRLGDWGKWLDDAHTKMEYNGGERCWNGPDRKTIVELTCGDANRAVSVQEPNKCEYLMEFITPAACSPERLALLEQELARLENPGEAIIPLSADDILFI